MFLDAVFLLITTFIVAFVWLRYYISNNLVCLFSAIAICILFFLAFKALTVGKKEKRQLKKKQKKQAENLAVYLAMLPDKNTVALFEELPNLRQKEIKKCGNSITYKDGGKTVRFIFDFFCNAMTAKTFCDYIKQAANDKVDKVEIFANSFDKSVLQLQKSVALELKLFDANYTFALLKDNNMLPCEITEKKYVSPLRTNFLQIVFDKSRAKYYLMSSLFLLLTSFLTFFKLYYLISGTVLFFLFLYARFNRRFNAHIENTAETET